MAPGDMVVWLYGSMALWLFGSMTRRPCGAHGPKKPPSRLQVAPNATPWGWDRGIVENQMQFFEISKA